MSIYRSPIKPNADGLFRVLYPENKLVTAEQILAWASDDMTDILNKPYTCTDFDEAIDILEQTGSVTFARQA